MHKSVKYGSVRKFFEKEHPELVKCLGNPGEFWEQIKTNKISQSSLDRFTHPKLSDTSSNAWKACRAIKEGREHGKIKKLG